MKNLETEILVACSACGAEMFFATTPQGKKIPLNKISKKGIVLLEVGDPNERRKVAVVADVYESHFATCPNAKDFRKSKG